MTGSTTVGQSRVRKAVRLGVSYGGAQVVQQVTAAITGILIVRGLTKGDYAAYSFLIGLVPAISALVDAGLNSAMHVIGGRVHAEAGAFARLILLATRYRLRASTALAILLAPVAVILLGRLGVEVAEAMALVLVTAVVVVAMGFSAVLQLGLRLQYEFTRVTTLTLQSSILRLLLTIAVLAVVPTTVLPLSLLLALAAVSLFEVVRLRSRLQAHLPRVRETDPEHRRQMRSAVAHLLPLSVFSVAQSQLLYFLLAGLGATHSLAEIAALSRFAVAYSVLNLTITGLLIPVLARREEPADVRRFFLLVVGFGFGSAVVLTGLLAVVKQPLLALLGAGYQGLQNELLLVLVGAATANMAATISAAVQARGWLRWSWLYMPASVLWLALLLSQIDVSSTLGAAQYVALSPLPLVVTPAISALVGLRRDAARPDALTASAPPVTHD